MNKLSLSPKELAAFKKIRNFLIHQGQAPSLRELMNSLGYQSPRSSAVLVNNLIRKGYLRRKADGKLQLLRDPEDHHNKTVNIPLIGSAPCGTPILAEENFEALIPVSSALIKPNCRYFLLRAVGDSMDRAKINDGDLVLVKQQNTAEDGDIVVALVDDEATIKEFYKTPSAIILKPKSTNKSHQPIILMQNFRVQGVVVGTVNANY